MSLTRKGAKGKAIEKAMRAKSAIHGTGTHEKVTGGEHFRKI